MFFLILLFLIFNSVLIPQSNHAFISGRVINLEHKSPLVNSNISIKGITFSEVQYLTGTVLFGSGFLYNQRRVVVNLESGKSYLEISVNKLQEFFMYFRVDMGLTASFEIGPSESLIAVVEVLNLFDHRNYGGYRFVQVSDAIPNIFAIPQILSSRFFNVGMEMKF